MSIASRINALRAELASLKRHKEPDPPGVTIPEYLVRSAKLASWMATASLIYFLWLYTLDIARNRAGELHLTNAGTWTGDLQFWFPYIVGFAIVAVGIPYVAKLAIPTFMSLDWRTNLWPKAWSLFIAVAVSLVVLAGTFTVQGGAIMERGREAAVAVAGVEQQHAVLQSQITAKEAELRSMMENHNAYLAQAASVGAAEWQRSYINQTAASDPQRERIVRALGAARAADAVRAELGALRAQAATQTTTAAVTERVETPHNAWIGQTLDWLEGARAMLLSMVMDIVCLLMPWIAMRLEQQRAVQLAMAGPRSDLLALPDFSKDDPIEAEPMKPPREVVRDAETGEELERIKPKEYWRRKKGQRQKVETVPESLPDEVGAAYDGGGRTGVTAEELAMSGAMPGEIEPFFDRVDDGERPAPEPEPETLPAVLDVPPLTDEEIEALAEADDLPLGEDGADGVMVQEREDA
jgi:hypothetical protein